MIQNLRINYRGTKTFIFFCIKNCPNCQAKVEVDAYSFDKMPEILIIEPEMFSENQVPIESPVNYREQIQVRETNDQNFYELCGIVTYVTDKQRFAAFVRNESNEWNFIDNERFVKKSFFSDLFSFYF